MLFFNDEGDEVGGLTFTGTDDNGRRANAGIMFDQLKQDQTIGIVNADGAASIEFLDAAGNTVQRVPASK